jgi:diguanylate cyclase (GGDEF)-like protein/PAS domain S-box-containing protein
MHQVLACLTLQHDWRLVLLAVGVCLLASGTAIGLFRRAKAMSGRTRAAWLMLDAAAAGFGIWATHFIAMLAYEPGFSAGFDLRLTVLSLAVAVTISGMGQYFILLARKPLGILAGGAVVGAGISAMHYMGMAALEVPGRLEWNAELVLISVAAGVTLSSLAFYLAASRTTVWSALSAAALFAAAIVAMHFIGMGALTIAYDPRVAFNGSALSSISLSIVMAGTAMSILALCLMFALLDWRTRERIQLQKLQLNTALENMSQGLCMFDPNGRVLLFNERYSEITGLPPARLKKATLLEIIQARKKGVKTEDPEEFAAQIIGAIRQGKGLTMVVDRLDGRTIRSVSQPMPDGGWVATLDDITEWQKAQAQIFHMARHDALTNLPNRTLFRERLEAALQRVGRGERVGVICIDLDRFKPVNDTLGHLIGDALLKEVAGRLANCVRNIDMVARIGGDEFAIVQSGADLDASDFARSAQRVVEAVSALYTIEHNQIVIGASIGISVAPEDGTDVELLLRNADLAMYRAKADGRGTYRFFEPGMDARAQARRIIDLELRGALAREEFDLYYQPIHRLIDSEIVAFEALIRWNHPLRGHIIPGDFISVAEDSGLIHQIGHWVLRRACRDAAAWPRPVGVAVNMSPVQFRNPDLVRSLQETLAEFQLSPSRLELEITEAVLLDESETTRSVLHELRGLGVRIAMDDFGTGYSSLGYLRSFPFDKIKIDQSFVRDLTTRADAIAIVRAVTGLAKSLGIATTAEGVETAEQVSVLKAEGCTEVQGFHYAAPRPAREVAATLSRRGLRLVAG